MIPQNVYTPQMLGERLTAEQMDAADARGAAPLITPDPGLFEGLSQSFRGLPSGLMKSASAMAGVISGTSGSAEGLRATAEEANEELADYGFHIDDTEAFGTAQAQANDNTSRAFRQYAKAEWGVDPATMGTVAQIVHGLFETLPEAAVYSLAGPGVGSLLFGADMGIRTAQELRDQGVDEQTAARSGLWSFAGGALGLRIPAAFGPNRWLSALGGAAVNVGFTGAEQAGIAYTLRNDDYNAIADRYGLTWENAGASALFGAAAGAFFFRTPNMIRRAEQAQKLQAEVTDAIYKQLRGTDTYLNKPELAYREAQQKAVSLINLAREAGKDPMDILPQIKFENGEVVLPEDALGMTSIGNDVPGIRWAEGLSEIPANPLNLALSEGKVGDAAKRLKIRLSEERGRKAESGEKHPAVTRITADGLEVWITSEGIAETVKQGTRGQGKDIATAVLDNLEPVLERSRTVRVDPGEGASTVRHLVATAYVGGQPVVVRSVIKEKIDINHNTKHWGYYGSFIHRVSDTDKTNGALSTQGVYGSTTFPMLYAPSVSTTLYDWVSRVKDDGERFPKDKTIPRQEVSARQSDEKWIPDEELVAQARQTFGVTSDPREAFYVLRDGTMLDGSGRHWDPSHPEDYAGGRQVDHQEINELDGIHVSGPEAMYDWMARTGAMRFDQIVGIASVARDPTPQQLALLGRVSKGKYLALSRNTPEGRIVNDVEFERASPRKIEAFFADAKARYERGEVTRAYAQRDRGNTAGYFDPETSSIVMTKNASLSTFSHEWAHWYLQQLFAFTKEGTLVGEMRADFDALLETFGVKNVDEWNAMSREQRVRFHEQFARQFEQYLSTGKAPDSRLQYVFEAIANAIKEAYAFARSSIADEYKAQTGYDLPPMSPEVKAVFDRMFKGEGSKPSVEQVAAARAAQAAIAAQRKLNALDRAGTASPAAHDARQRAARSVEQAMIEGRSVDVSSQADALEIDPVKVDNLSGTYTRTFMADSSSPDNVVILQNRDRSRVASVGQMNAIAARPEYGLLSFSRNAASGAPIVAFGGLPDSRYLGARDYVVDTTGKRIPVQYAVVEADSVLTSNDIVGRARPEYGTPGQMNAVAGNGRATGVQAAYERGSSGDYRAALEDDAQHGIPAETIRGMKKPMLVRIMPDDQVTTGFVKRSNQSQALERSAVEVAVDDAPKIRQHIGEYEFSENGVPTKETVQRFAADRGDPNALNRMFTSDGKVTAEAGRTIRQAVFYEAYRDPRLTALFSEDIEDSGVARILNFMVGVAPRIIQIREATGGRIDLGKPIIEAVNGYRNGARTGDVDLISGGQDPLIGYLERHSNSAKALRESVNEALTWAQRAIDSETDALFGDAVRVDTADVVARIIDEENAAIRRINESNPEGTPLPEIPAVDAAELRGQYEHMREVLRKTEQETADLARDVERLREKAESVSQDVVDQANATPRVEDLAARRAAAMESLDEAHTDAARIERVREEMGDQLFSFEDADGNTVTGTVDELMARADQEIAQADAEAASYGTAAQCILLNRGIE
ncbi:MAG: hypothetical protein IJ164_04380 [Duodenibacillus sp.]|nr:hypothetical protein [Duodenibacillus sp.]